jgi:hypothetical protein
MAHDATKVLLGTTNSSQKVVTNETADPATFVAGLAVRRASDGGLQTEDDSTAALIGVSLGKALSNDTKKTAVARKGLGVPLKVKLAYATGIATINAYADLLDGDFDSFEVGDVEFVAQSGAATEGDATFRAATSDEATAESLAAQINAHEDTKDLVTAVADGATVIVTAKDYGTGGNAIVFTFNDNTENTAGEVDTGGTLEGGVDSPVALGGKVYVNDDGEGCDSGDGDAAATGATYASGDTFSGVNVSGEFQYHCALIDIRGSL